MTHQPQYFPWFSTRKEVKLHILRMYATIGAWQEVYPIQNVLARLK